MSNNPIKVFDVNKFTWTFINMISFWNIYWYRQPNIDTKSVKQKKQAMCISNT